jgi:hypothetical protein
MINTEPSKVIQEILDPLKHVDNSYIEQMGITDKGELVYYDVQHPFLKSLVLERLYSFFLYPPACLCDQLKKKCLCDQKRQKTYEEQSIEAYKINLDVRDRFLKSSHQETESIILSAQQLYGLSEDKARECHLKALNNTHETLKKICERLTGIQSEKELISSIEKLANTEEMGWRTKLKLKTDNKQSSYSIAMSIGQRLLSQIYFLQKNELKTAGGRHGFLSVNRIITDVLEGKSLEYFYGLKHPKRKIENAWYEYRSILHLLLGHFSARAGLLGTNTLEGGILTFISAYKIQELFIRSSLKTFTPHSKARLFSDKNLVCFHPDAFIKDYPMIRDFFIFMLCPEGIPVLCRKDQEQAVLDRLKNFSF